MDIAIAGYLMAMAGALLAGLVSGLAGFGTGLVAAGIWLHVMPAEIVPALVVLTSVTGQLVGLALLGRQLNWRGAMPYLFGGVAGVPVGVLLLSMASPAAIRLAIGVFLLWLGWFGFNPGSTMAADADAIGRIAVTTNLAAAALRRAP